MSATIKNVEEQIKKLKSNGEDPEELDRFFKLYKRFKEEGVEKIDWSKIEQPKGKILDYKSFELPADSKTLLNKLVVLKLNGGLGTTMGMKGPKSDIEIRKGLNFIDMVVEQIETLNKEYDTKIPLILMNSFNTDEATKKTIKDYKDIRTFNQCKFVRINQVDYTLLDGKKVFYPPGHGDLFYSLDKCGMLDQLIEEGKEILFVSNIDNLAASVDVKILEKVLAENIDFCMELTNKTRADIKGGTLINYENSLKLLEVAMVPNKHLKEFKSTDKFKTFNTNSVWINLKALKKKVASLNLDIIANRKVIEETPVFQLETAIGSGIKFFENAAGIIVPRSRFLPIKACTDLFLCASDLFISDSGVLKLNPKRITETLPTIKLVGRNYKKFNDFRDSFQTIPSIVDLEALTVSGNVKFGKNVTLKGVVTIIADPDQTIFIPTGTTLEDTIITGGIKQIDY